MVSPSDPFWQYDFDDAYFNSDDDDMDSGGCGDDMDTSSNDDDMDISDCNDDMTTSVDTDSEYDSEEEEFWFVFPLNMELGYFSITLSQFCWESNPIFFFLNFGTN